MSEPCSRKNGVSAASSAQRRKSSFVVGLDPHVEVAADVRREAVGAADRAVEHVGTTEAMPDDRVQSVVSSPGKLAFS